MRCGSYTTHKVGHLPMAEKHTNAIITQIADLESRVAFQDDTIETLNQLVTQQFHQIQQLEHKLKLLGERFQQLQERNDEPSSSNPADERPPHY